MKKFLILFILLFTFLCHSNAEMLICGSGEGGGTECTEGTGTLDNSPISKDDRWSVTGEDTDYQEVKNSGEKTICKVVVDHLIASAPAKTFTIEIRDASGNAIENGDQCDSCEVDTADPGETCTFTFSSKPVVDGDFRIYLQEIDDGVEIGTESSAYEAGYQLYILSALRDWQTGFNVWTDQ